MLTQGEIRVEILNKKPEIYDRLKERFPSIEWEDGIAIVVGTKIYSKYPVRNDVLAHELTHVQQQVKFGEKEWWDKYIEDDAFRLSQEIEAYATQVKWIKDNTEKTTRPQRRMMIQRIARDLSSEMYGNIINFNDAKRLIAQ